jgi:YesN/AraC family two-component response regulator
MFEEKKMKILQTQITESLNSYISVLERDEPFFKSPFHAHPELELVYIKESFGKRIIGNTITHFEAGDMVFIGANLPHVWLSDELYYKEFSKLRAKAIVVYFNSEVFGKAFYHLAETSRLADFFQKAKRGIVINGNARKKAAQKLEKLIAKKGLDKIIGLLEILDLLSASKETEFITPETYTANIHTTENDRLFEVYQHIRENFKDDISLNKLAEIAHLTPQSFCRLFKKRTGRHFTEYLNEVRISSACTYLLETDWSVSEIAYSCGYKSVSYFNRLFKHVTGYNPKTYRENATS